MSEFDFEVYGAKQHQQLFDEFRDDIKRKIILDGFKKAGKIIVDTAKGYLASRKKQGTSNTEKSIGVKDNKTSADVELLVGARRYGSYKGYLAHLIDKGSADRQYVIKSKKHLFKPKKSTHYTGRMKATNFWTDAINDSQQQAQDAIGGYVIESFNRYVVNAEKKNKTIL